MRTPKSLIPGLLLFAAAFAACKAVEAPRPVRGLDLPPAVAHAPRVSDYDVQDYALDLEIHPETRSIRGTCRIRAFPRAAPLEALVLDLEDLEVSSVTDDRGRALAFERRPGTLRIVLPEPVDPGDCIEVEVAYGGEPRRGMYFSGIRDGVPTQVFTQGECEDSRGWFPCFDAPSERALSEIRVTMPGRWTAVAAGERLERSDLGGKATELWRITTPHPAYLTTLVAGEFETHSTVSDGIPLLALSAPPLAPRLEPNLRETGAMLAEFANLTGRAYPYAKYSQACVDDYCFGGMENISATTLTDTCLLDEKGRKDAPATGLVAHEAAHQWFGNLITCSDWSHIWLNEGFATYFAALYTEHAEGVDAFRAQMRDLQDAFVAADVGQNRRAILHDVYRRPMDLFFTGHAYGGGAVRLHLLRSVLGDEGFFRGIREYVAREAGRSVTTDDFRKAMEIATGKDLAEFFREWLGSPGYPEFESTWRYDERRQLVILSVSQVQDVAGGTPAVFHAPVEIGIRDAAGQRTVRLALDRRRQLFEIPAPEKPVFVRFDAHSAIPKRLEERKPVEEWIAIASADEDVNGRRDAVAVLARILSKVPAGGSEPALVAALTERLSKDTSPAVRAGAAAGLSGVLDPAARPALVAAATGDAEARVRGAALDALCGFGVDEELAELGLREHRAAFSWNTAAAAAALFGTARPKGFVDWLRAELESAPDPLRSRMLPLFGRARDPGALDAALRWAGTQGAGEETRAVAAREVGNLGRGKPEARRALEELLETGTFRIRREAAMALGALRDPAALDALRKAHARTTLVPELRAIESACEALEGPGHDG